MRKIIIVMIMALFAGLNVEAQQNRIPAKGVAKTSKESAFEPFSFTRRALGETDILIEILYTGVCHSDVHSARGEWGSGATYPIVPGHEIVGKVVSAGSKVTKFKVGDYAGIGAFIHACGTCDNCKRGEEQFCTNGTTFTYGRPDKYHNNDMAYGGYSDKIVMDERFTIKIPQNADLKRISPLLCAGVTVYNPLQFSNVKSGDTVAVAGFGGLGHLAVKYAVAKGAKVWVFDITESKRQVALDMGATGYVNVNNTNELANLRSKFSFILSTIPANYDPLVYVGMLRENGEMAIVGQPAADKDPKISVSALPFFAHRKIYGSLIGGIALTQDVINYSVENNIYPDVEIISPYQIDEAFDKIVAGEVKFRYVIDIKKLK
jgi:uncharacterized zinc-type alcohol dehydrogenase-like protein